MTRNSFNQNLATMKLKLICFVIIFEFCSSAKIPSNFIKCDRKKPDFKKCAPGAVEQAMRQMDKPTKELGIPSLSPLVIPSLSIAGGEGSVKLDQNYKNVHIYGLTNLSCSKLNVDFENKIIENECLYPEIRMVSDYNLNGKILVLDIMGEGKGTITLEKVRIPVKYDLEEYEKNGKKHFRVTNIDLKMIPERVRFDFENLFNGDKKLSEHVLNVINENWREVYDDAKASYEDAFGQITKDIFNKVLSKVSISDMFGDE
ncbi:protein takeout-like [Tribolium madens]|uniref:protein takeout-like n=1 Tax=Tribolium madens TaxID=41895 RepID=UPI001CF7297D|nr:protein takeout-like [Tribolium madens]